jgi:hypothetical protein
MDNQFSQPSADLTAKGVVDALLEADDFDPKQYADDHLPDLIKAAEHEVEKRFYQEFKAGKLRSFDHMYDRGVEIAGEVATDYHLDDNVNFEVLIQRALRTVYAANIGK